MGNRLSTRGSSKRKRKKIEQKRNERKELKDDIYERCEGVLEIDDFCEADEENSTLEKYSDRNKDCKKANRHCDYIPFENLTLEHLPDPIKHSAVFDYIRARGNLVVLISVSERSPGRDDEAENKSGSVASGYACVCEGEKDEAICPILKCPFTHTLGENHKVYGGLLVTTNRHVIIDDSECENSTFYFYYEKAPLGAARVRGKGYCLRDDSSENKDYVGVKVFVHKADIVDQIRQFSSQAVRAWEQIPPEIKSEFEKHTVVISHPHGWPKQVSFGKLKEKEMLLDVNWNEDDAVNDGNSNSGDSGGGGDNGSNDTKADGDDSKNNNNNENKKKKKKKLLPGRRVSKYTSLTCKGSSGSPVLTGFYWNNPFVHSTGVVVSCHDDDDHDCEKMIEFWGESYFY